MTATRVPSVLLSALSSLTAWAMAWVMALGTTAALPQSVATLMIGIGLGTSQDEGDTLRAEVESLWRTGQRAEALERLSLALDESPGDLWLRRLLVEHQLAVHRYAAAFETARPAGAALQSLQAEALFLLDRFEEALPLLDSSNPTQALARVEGLEILGRSEQARLALEGLGELPESHRIRRALVTGRLEASAGRHELAAQAFETVLAEDPVNPGALFGLGQALVRTGRRDEGLVLLTRHREIVPLMDELDFAVRAVDLSPLHAPNHASVGDAQRKLGRFEPARASYQAALLYASPEQLPPVALRFARLLEEDLGDVGAAVELLDEASSTVDDLRLLVRAGDILLRSQAYGEARLRFEQALTLRPQDGAIIQRIEAAKSLLESAGADSANAPSPDQ